MDEKTKRNELLITLADVNNSIKEIEKIRQLFNMQDYAKELLLSSTTERQDKNARSFLERINLELKTLYIPTPIENV